MTSPNLLEKGNDDDSPDVGSGKDNNSTVVDGSGNGDSSCRKTSDTSSSPNLVIKENEEDDIETLVNTDPSDEDKQQVPLKAKIVQKVKSVFAKHKKVVEVEIEEEEVHERKTNSRFCWSHMADCIEENAITKDEN